MKKGRDAMNIFENNEGFFGSIEIETINGGLLSLFQLAKEIQTRLGKQSYLLDCYLSIFFDGLSNVLSYETAEEGLIESNALEIFFCDLFQGTDEKEWNPLYKRAKELFDNQADKLPYQEQHTKVCLLMILIADDMMLYSVADFVNQQSEKLSKIIDQMRMEKLYKQISYIVGESMMEQLNLKLQERFLIAPAVRIFAQGINNDLIDILTMRDDETSKQMFQLFLDNLPKPL